MSDSAGPKEDEKRAVLHERIAELEQALRDEALRRRQSGRLKTVIDRANSGVGIVDMEGRFVYMNRYFAEVHGLRVEDCIGRHFGIFHTPRQLAEIGAAADAILSSGEWHGLEVWHHHQDGSDFPMLMNGIVLDDADGAPAFLATTAVDITELKAAQTRLDAEQRKYRRIFENIQDVYYEVTLDGVILEVSPSIQNILGYSRQEAIGKNVTDTYANPNARREFLRRIRQDGQVTDYEIQLWDKSGEAIYCAISSKLITDADGGPAGIVGILRPIEARKQAEERLRESEARLREQNRHNRLRAEIWKLASAPDLSESEFIQRMLSTVGQALDLGRACYNLLPEPDKILCVNEWCRDGVAPSIGTEFRASFIRTLHEGESLLMQRDRLRQDLPPDTSEETIAAALAEGDRLNLASVLALPLCIEERAEAVLAFEVCLGSADAFDWTPLRRSLAQEVVQIIAQVIRQKRTERDLQAAHEKLEQRVRERTRELSETNRRLQEEIRRHKAAEAALRASEEKFRNLSEEISDGVAVWVDGSFYWVNKAFAEMFAYTQEEMIGGGLELIVLPERVDLVRDRITKRLDGKEVPGHYEAVARRKDGSHLSVEITAKVIHFDGLPSIQVVVRNITERKKAEEEKRRLERQMWHAQKLESLGVLAGGIAHDFNNLLLSILGHADLALMDLNVQGPAHDSVEQIKTASLRAAELTNQLLAYSGRGRLSLEHVDLSRLVQEMMHLLKTGISKKAFLKHDLRMDLPAVKVSPAQIRQVVMNLITNASDAIGDRPGLITITTGLMEAGSKELAELYINEGLPEGRYVFVEVADTGCGMDAEAQARIFDPFFTTKFTGRGLGLAAALGIVRSHGGGVRIESELDVGTSFRILLPATDEPAALVEDTSAGYHAAPAGGITVLVVDDEPTALVAARMMLEKSGYRVLAAEDGYDAVECFRDHADEVDLVLLDLTMPRMDGIEACRRIQGIRPDVRVILTSGYGRESLEQDRDLAFSGFLHKPYQMADLLGKIGQVLGT